MEFEVLEDPDAVAKRAARLIVAAAREAVNARGRFVIAVSGGRTPWVMLRRLAAEDVPWANVHVVQVDERIAPDGDPDRNLVQLRSSLLERARVRDTEGSDPSVSAAQVYPMPVECEDLTAAARRYAATLEALAGSPPTLDVVHLGLGSDGHTASLVPSDPALDVDDAWVAVTRVYQGRRRMTLTYPIIDRARRILWVVTGAEKAAALDQLRRGDRSIPGGRVRQDNATVLADRAATAR